MFEKDFVNLENSSGLCMQSPPGRGDRIKAASLLKRPEGAQIAS